MLLDRAVLSYVLLAPAGGNDDAGSQPAVPAAAAAVPPIQASRTTEGDDQASRLWRACRRRKRQPETITIEELAGRGAEQLMTELAQFATAEPIPVYFDEDLQPTTDTNRCCVASTLTGYVGKYLKHMRNIHPNHPDWKDLKKDESPSWWPSLCQACYDKASRNQIKWQGHYYEWGVGETRPLYLDLDANDGDHPLKKCD